MSVTLPKSGGGGGAKSKAKTKAKSKAKTKANRQAKGGGTPSGGGFFSAASSSVTSSPQLGQRSDATARLNRIQYRSQQPSQQPLPPASYSTVRPSDARAMSLSLRSPAAAVPPPVKRRTPAPPKPPFKLFIRFFFEGDDERPGDCTLDTFAKQVTEVASRTGMVSVVSKLVSHASGEQSSDRRKAGREPLKQFFEVYKYAVFLNPEWDHAGAKYPRTLAGDVRDLGQLLDAVRKAVVKTLIGCYFKRAPGTKGHKEAQARVTAVMNEAMAHREGGITLRFKASERGVRESAVDPDGARHRVATHPPSPSS